MRGNQDGQEEVFSYIPLEKRVPQDHPLRREREMTGCTRFRDFAVQLAESADGRGPDTGSGGDCRCRMALDAQKRPCSASDRRNRLSHNCTPACVVGQVVSPVNPVTPSQARDPGQTEPRQSRANRPSGRHRSVAVTHRFLRRGIKGGLSPRSGPVVAKSHLFRIAGKLDERRALSRDEEIETMRINWSGVAWPSVLWSVSTSQLTDCS